MKKLLSAITALVLALSLSTVAFAEEQVSAFSDVPSSHWAYTDIMTIVNKGAIGGTKEPVNGVGHYEPEGTVSLGQFLTVLTRLLAPEEIGEHTGGNWASPYYRAATKSGIITSSDFNSTDTSLNRVLSREDMAYILVNAAKVNGETLEILPNVENMMKDYSDIPYDRQDAVKRAYSNALLAGDTNGNFKPSDPMTRAQMATVVCRLMEYTPRGTVTVPDSSSQTPEDKVTQGGYVSNVGETKGMLLSKYSREYEHKALQAARTGSDDKGVFVTFTAPILPDEINDSFTYTFTADVYKSNGDYFADTIKIKLKPGESKTVHFVSFEDTGVKTSQIGSMSVAVSINNAENKHMFTRRIENTDKTSTYGVWYDSEVDKTSLDCSAVWAGIGK